MRRSWLFSLLSVVPMLVTFSAAGQEIPNWHAPPTWTPPRPAGAISVMTDISNPLPFVPVDPCRIADTRGGQFSDQAGSPPLAANVTRTFQIGGTVPGVPDPGCGIPLTARAVSFQFTVIQPNSDGNLVAWPSGPMPTVSVLNWAANIFALGNGIVVPISATGGLNVIANAPVGGTTQLTIDVNGYYYDSQLDTGAIAPGRYFGIVGDRSGGPVVLGRNTNASANSYGIQGEATANGSGSAGIYGLASATSGTVFGVFGRTSSTPAVPSNASAGVKGVDSGGELSTTVIPASSGVRGDSVTGVGVSGFSRATGIAGSLLNTGGAVVASGYLGYSAGSYGVYAVGDIGATGMKFFVEPHPTDASKVIRFVALEGPEAGTYFRGSSRTVGGSAFVEVPESFRIVTDEEGLTVQLTAVGALVPLAVISKDLNQITVRSSRDVAFDYEVKGVRRGFSSFDAITRGQEFMPESADARLPTFLSSQAQQRLIANGTFNQDGSVNLTTAARLGWTRIWTEREGALASPRSALE